ncbi:uncharacterized protein LOC133184928 [Saccostrea echinata]|uniref:uncharacterized protein LOC133184928 n=1 Tax=Saccostrea echinata TaxID=191078 RepID=UPI002A7EA7B9|nr:uncharacterized protein LOC133184928 [Saccostrea echinata]
MPRSKKGTFVKASFLRRLEGLRRAREARALKGKQDVENDGLCLENDSSPVLRSVECQSAESSWRVGRRIVELGTLVDNLKRGCAMCGNALQLVNTIGERKFGLGQVLQIKCTHSTCAHVNDIPTGSKHRVKADMKQYAWDVNTKLAAGMLNGGYGITHVNALLAALNIPGITNRSLKSREREVGEHLEEMAGQSCNKVLQEEMKLSDGDITVSFDGAWQKRGTGRGYNSLTGHASLVGEKTKKIVSFSSKSKKCRICSAASGKGVPPRKHNCRRNWHGSAKAMEPAMACEMLSAIQDEGCKIGTLVMDNDSTTIAHVKATVDPTINKRADKNHTKKGFTGALIELANTHKVLKNQKLRGHIERCFTYCVQQNRGKAKELEIELGKIVPHLYGEHEYCGTWCQSKKTDYKPRNLPYGKPLSCTLLREALEGLFKKYCCKAEELAMMGSTQVNENFNHMVSTKAPKRF